MAKVITLSRTFPKGHQKAGQPTFFVEKVWASLDKVLTMEQICAMPAHLYGTLGISEDALDNCAPKHHTIRAGKRWKTGDMASLRVWSGKPYNSPQITIAPDVELTVRDIEIDDDGLIWIDGAMEPLRHGRLSALAQNDGLTIDDMAAWFNKLPFSGQILIWNNQNLPY